VKIRAGSPDDRGPCIELWLQALRARDGRGQDDAVAERARAKFHRPLVRFAVIGSDPRGFALTVDAGDGPGRHSALLELLAVAPSETGHGLGRILLDDAIQTATQLGYLLLKLHVRAGNDRAEKLYKASGFEPHGDPAPHPLGGHPMIAYERTLAHVGN
jgi:GNAT superfamily N-acetyltransferase